MSPIPRPTSWIGALRAGLLHAVLFTLAFPPYDLWPLAYLALIPLALLALRTTSRLRAVLCVWFTSALAWLWVQRWMIDVTGPGYVMLAVAQGAFPAAFVWLLATLRPRGRPPLMPGLTNVLLVPVLWTATEMFRGSPLFLTGYPWFFLAHPLIAQPVLCQAADLLGTYFVSFAAATLAGVFADLLTLPLLRAGRMALSIRVSLGVFAVVQAFAIGYGLWRVAQADRLLADPALERLRVAVVQTNLPQNNKQAWTIEEQFRDFAHFVEITRAWASGGGNGDAPDLVVWPETMVPGVALNIEAMRDTLRIERETGRDLRAVRYFHEALALLAEEMQTPLLVGASAVEDLQYVPETATDAQGVERTAGRWKWKARYNSALLFSAQGRIAERRYDKVHRTPFGEVIPIAHRWPGMQQRLLNLGARGMSFDLDAGRDFTRLAVSSAGREHGEVLVGTPICFESTMSYVCRALVNGGDDGRADLLINLTNDGWFGRLRGGREQHLQIGRFRCIENRVPMVRAANTGISAAIDSAGRIIRYGPSLPPGSAAWNAEGVMIASMTLQARPTLYAAVGDAFGWMCLGLTALLTLWATVFRGSRRASGDQA